MTKSTTLLAAPKIGWLVGIIFVEYQLASCKNPDFLIQTSLMIGAKKARVSLWRGLVANDLLPRPYVTSPLRPEGRVETQHVPDSDSCTSLSFCLEEGKRKGSNNNNIYTCCLWHFNHSPWLWCPRRFLSLRTVLIPSISCFAAYNCVQRPVTAVFMHALCRPTQIVNIAKAVKNRFSVPWSLALQMIKLAVRWEMKNLSYVAEKRDRKLESEKITFCIFLGRENKYCARGKTRKR